MKRLDIDKIKSILIRSTNWIGDAVMTTPAVRAVKKNFPYADISILVKPWVAPVFENSPHIDRLIMYDSTGRHKGLIGKVRIARDVRRYRFDAAILFQNAFEAAFIAFLAGIPNRIGFNTDARGLLLSHSVPCGSEIKSVHQTRYYMSILERVGLDTDGQDIDLVVNEESKQRALEILGQHSISMPDKLVGINPSATFGPAKQWFPDRYARLGDRIQEVIGARVILFGGPEDQGLGRKISRLMKHPPIDLCGKTDLEEAMALIQQCDLFITNDSGLMHVAAALNVPVIAIFGSTNPVTTGPWSPKSRIVRVPIDCSPCLKPECPEKHLSCMDLIDVDKVFEAARGML
ncbi:lipopolysaccharide heptosyltransferase II [Thermodesulfobacteriota bacterium]